MTPENKEVLTIVLVYVFLIPLIAITGWFWREMLIFWWVASTLFAIYLAVTQ